MKRIATFIIVLTALTAFTVLPTQVTPEPAATDLPQAGMPNPASVYCTQTGYKLEIRAAADGSQCGKIVHLYGTLLSNVPDVNGSQIQADRIEVEE